MTSQVLAERLVLTDRENRLLRQALVVAVGITALIVCAKAKVPVWPSPVPITLGTFAVLSIGASYGPRLGLVTILGYMIIGALGFDVFANSSAEKNGLAYMMGGTGGYLVGYRSGDAGSGRPGKARLGPSRWMDGPGDAVRQRTNLRSGLAVAVAVRFWLGAEPGLGPLAFPRGRCDEIGARCVVVPCPLETRQPNDKIDLYCVWARQLSHGRSRQLDGQRCPSKSFAVIRPATCAWRTIQTACMWPR